MRPIGYFLLLFSCILTNMTHSMDFSMQEKQRYPQTQVDYAADQSFDQAQADYYADQSFGQAQAEYYAAQHYAQAQAEYDAAQHYAQVQAQYNAEQRGYAQYLAQIFQFAPHVNVLDNFSTASQSQVTRPVNKTLRKRKFMPQSATTETLLKKNCSRPPSKTKKLIIKSPSPIKTDNPAFLDFIVECPSCKNRIYSLVKDDLRHEIGKHSKSKYQLTKEEIAQSLKKIIEPTIIRKFSMTCPFQTCPTDLISYRRKDKLRPILLAHLKKSHENYQEEYPIRKLVRNEKAFKNYFKKYGKTTPILNPNTLKKKFPVNLVN